MRVQTYNLSVLKKSKEVESASFPYFSLPDDNYVTPGRIFVVYKYSFEQVD